MNVSRFFMVVFTRKYPLQRLLKKRFFKANKLPKLRYGTIGLYCLHTFRFEYRYCLFLRKFFKKLFNRRRRKITTLHKRKTWLYIRPNYVLTHKSKNARMGKGKGNFKRWCTIVYPGRVFIEHINISPRLYANYVRKVNNKLKIHIKVIHAASFTVKNKILDGTYSSYTDNYNYVRVRNSFYTGVLY